MSRPSAPGPGGKVTADPGSPSFETALSRLEEIVHRLERGEITLDESLSAFREGSELVKFCLDRLNAAEKAVQELIVGDNGGLSIRATNLDDASGDPDA